MTNPASPRLPEAVEQAIYAADEVNTRIAEAPNGSDLTDLYTEWGEALTALRAAILAYGAARERQGIERAAALPSAMAAEREAMVARRRERFNRDDGLTVQIESERHTMAGLANALRALPVDGATP